MCFKYVSIQFMRNFISLYLHLDSESQIRFVMRLRRNCKALCKEMIDIDMNSNTLGIHWETVKITILGNYILYFGSFMKFLGQSCFEDK